MFITIPVDSQDFNLADFKADYKATTGENIQNNPPINEEETHYLVGSSKLTQEQADGLVERNPSVTIGSYPVGWVTKDV